MICVGTIITALSMSFEAFMVGRVVTGSGAAGVLVVASIIVIQMADQKNRGLYLGFVNSGMTVGISLGAIIAGALEPRIGWVSTSWSESITMHVLADQGHRNLSSASKHPLVSYQELGFF